MRELITDLIFVLLFVVLGGTLGHAGVTVADWHFWVAIACGAGAYLCGTFKKRQ